MTTAETLRVCYLKQRFEPEPAPLRGAVFAHQLRDRGIELVVLTGFPYYPHNGVSYGYRQRAYLRELLGGIEVHRSISVVGHSGSPLRRALSYVSLPAASVVNALRNKVKADLVLTTLGPAPYGLFAQALAARLNVPCVLEIQDLWPESLIASEMWPQWLPTTPIEMATRGMYKHASAISCLSPGARHALISRGADPESTVVMLNWAQPVTVTDDDRRRAHELCGGWEQKSFIAYAGTIGPLQGVGRMCEAAVSNHHRLLIVGSGRSAHQVESYAAAMPDNVRFVGQQPLGVTRALLERSAATTVYLESSVLAESAIPSKFASNLLAGAPMVVAAEGETLRMADRVDAGPTCTPGDTDALARCFEEVVTATARQRTEWVQNAMIFSKDWTDPETSLDRFASLLRSVAARNSLASMVGRNGFFE